MRGTSPEETAMDLVVEDNDRVDAIYFIMSEDNVRQQLKLPWVSFGSDEGSLAPEGVFLKSSLHPRAYGNVARLLGKYVRDEKLIPLEAAIRRLTSLPAANLKLDRRGALKPGYFADIVVFDPATHPGPRHLRAAAPVRHRRARCVRQRRPGPKRRRAHRRQAGPGRPRARLEAPPGLS